MIQEPGQKLRRARERLRLRYRDVAEASKELAHLRGNNEFQIGLSRLADIENKGTVPSIYRLYTLCAIYKLDFASVLRWYGVSLDHLLADALQFSRSNTGLFEVSAADTTLLDVPVSLSASFDFRQTSYLGEELVRWGKIPAALLQSSNPRSYRYALMGTEDWSMSPLIAPGSFLMIDERRRRPEEEGWANEQDRPIYLIELRRGYRCGWCSVRGNVLVVQSHPTSSEGPYIYALHGEVDIVGQVVGVAMRLDQGRRRRIHS